MKIDLHVHARERSSCAKAGEEEMIRAALDRGLDGLAFTDHGRLMPPQRVAELNSVYAPFRVFAGIEIRVSGEDVLIFGIDDRALELRQWTYPDLHAFALQRGGFLTLAHPFRFRDAINIDVQARQPGAIEMRSMNIQVGKETRIRELAERLGVHLLCNSDAHRTADVGRFHNILPRVPQNDRELVSILKAGDYRCVATG